MARARWARWTLGVALLLGLAASSGCGDAVPANVGRIVGTVDTGGVSDVVQVSAERETGVPLDATGNPYTTTADASGHFELDGLAPGRYTVTARAGQWAGVCSGVEVTARAATSITVDLTPTGTLTGTATRGSGTGNTGILVWVVGTSYVAVTNDSGKYTINSVPVGSNYTVMATAPGYSVGQQTGVAVAAATTTTVPAIALVSTANHAPVITDMQPAGGTNAAKGEAVAVTVTASDADGDTLSYVWSATNGALSGSGASVTWTAPLQAGSFTITCVAQDGKGGLAQSSVTYTVTEVNVIVW